MQRIHIQRPRARRQRPLREVCPLDPRDPEVLRAKAIRRAAQPHQEVTRKCWSLPW